MAEIDSIQDLHAHLDMVCTSLEKLFDLVADQHDDLVQAASPAMVLFRETLDNAARHGLAR